MKKSLSLLLAVIMTLSVFSAAIIPAGAIDSALSVTASDFVNDQITFTIKLNTGIQKLTGAIFRVNFDSSVLKLVSGTAAGGNATPKVSGMYETDFISGKDNAYSLAYMNATGANVGATTDFFTVTFEAIAEDRPDTTVDFTCVEFVTDDGVDNDLKRSEGDAEQNVLSHTFKTLSTPAISAVDSTNGSIKVQWNACTGADYYNIYRADKGDEIIATVVDESYTDETIVENVEYTYYVTAENEHGETAKSAGKNGMYFGSIESASATAITNGIKVTWSPVSIATSYDVLRKLATDDESKFQKIANVAGTEYSDTSAASGVEYSYSVRAHYKTYTAGMACEYPLCIYIAVPKLYIANVSGGLQISVSSVGGATTYEIKKSTNGGAFSVIKTLDTESLSFVDTAVSGNVEYAYTVQAIANAELKSDVSTQVVATRLATPALTTIENCDSGVKVSWNAVSTATSYDVYRKTGSGEFAPIGSSDKLYFEDTTAVNGTTYTYTVVAKNATGCSAYDNAGKTIKRLNTPANIVSRTNASGIYVTWNAVSGAENYTIYRDGTAIGTSTTTKFADTKAAQNTLYKYTVRANSGSYYSAINATGAQGMNFGTVSSLKYTAIKNGITLSWNKLANAEGYRVYRKTASDSSYSKIATVTSGTSYNDTQMSSGAVYSYVVEAYKGTVVADMSAPVLSAKYLSAPVFTAKNSGEGKIKIAITAVRGADKYVIERADGTSTTYQAITTLTGGQLEYTDTKNIVAGQKYTYRVRAIASDGIKSFDSVVSMTKMIAPKLISCYNEIAGVQLKWTAVDGATQYYVYRKLPNQTAWTKLATLGKTQTAYIDASVVGNNVYQYTVEAKTADGLTGYDEIGRECRFIETPDLISRTNAVGGVTIKWNKVAGATSYRIYRRGAGVNYWYYLGDFPATLDTFTDLETANYFPNDAKKNALAKPKSGNYYRYTVRASYVGKDSTGKDYTIYSGFDTEGLYLKYVATPKLKAVSNSTNGITVTWNAVNGGGSTWYRVYRRGAGSTYWYYLGATQKTSFLDTKIANANNRYYRYTVRAVAGTADKGWYSAFDTTGLYLKRITNPVLVSATSANGGITVKWNAVAGSTGYYVYRKTASSGWVRVGTVGGVNNTTFIDTTAQRGVTYTYTVRACHGRTLSSFNSKGVSARR